MYLSTSHVIILSLHNIGYSVLTYIFAEDRERYLGYGEAVTGLGQCIGPIVGSLMFSRIGMLWTFIIFAIIIMIIGIFGFIFIPNSLNQKFSDSDSEVHERMSAKAEENSKVVSYSWFLYNRRAVFAFVSVAAMTVFCQFPSAFMVIALTNEFNIDTQYHGYVLAVPALFYVLSSFACSAAIDYLPMRLFMLIGFLIQATSLVLLGPSSIFNLPQYFWLYMIGYAVLGFS